MTFASDLGFEVGKEYKVVFVDGSTRESLPHLRVGDYVLFEEDDGTRCPVFSHNDEKVLLYIDSEVYENEVIPEERPEGTSKQDKYKLAYMDMAERFSETSEAVDLNVACLLVKDSHIISLGINGTPSGWPTNVCGVESSDNEPHVRHAEIQALNKLRRSTETSLGATAYVTHAPCKNCAIDLVEAGIKEVYYRYTYKGGAGLSYLKDKNVVVKQIT